MNQWEYITGHNIGSLGLEDAVEIIFYNLLILQMRKYYYRDMKWNIWSYRVSYWPNMNRI